MIEETYNPMYTSALVFSAIWHLENKMQFSRRYIFCCFGQNNAWHLVRALVPAGLLQINN